MPDSGLLRRRGLSFSSLTLSVLLLLGIVLCFWADLLFFSESRVVSRYGTDLSGQFLHSWKFGFGELRKGNVALWNPYAFSGMPFLGSFQAGLLYPINWIACFLPIEAALNSVLVFHVFLIGLGMLLWTRSRTLHPVACLFAAISVMFCGPYLAHLYPGHVSNLLTMAWVPFLFWSVDQLLERPTRKATLLGMLALAMMILAGHVQYVFNAVLVVSIYAALCLPSSPQPRRALLCLVIAFVGGLAIAAVQLLPGFAAALESSRGSGSDRWFLAMDSFPPENLLTTILPGFFGGIELSSYWGRWHSWETSLRFGVVAMFACLVGLTAVSWPRKRKLLTLLLVSVVLALGMYSPAFPILTRLPGFDRFRAPGKFLIEAAVILGLGVAYGFDKLIRERTVERRFTQGLFWAAGCGIALAAVVSAVDLQSGMSSVLQSIQHSHQHGRTADPGWYSLDSSAAHAVRTMRNALLTFGVFALGLAIIARKFSRHRAFPYLLLLLGGSELLIHAFPEKVSFHLNALRRPDLENLLEKDPGDYRILNVENPNSGTSLGIPDIWGHDPAVPGRYVELVNYLSTRQATGRVQQLMEAAPLYRMLRLKYVRRLKRQGGGVVQVPDAPLPRFQILRTFTVAKTAEELFSLISSPSFRPEKEVILENEPQSIRSVSAPDEPVDREQIAVLKSEAEKIELELTLSRPGILLITDSFSKGWKAVSSIDPAKSYEVMPANHALRAIPLQAGHHRIRMFYSPWGFATGTWISAVAVLFFFGAAFAHPLRRFALRLRRTGTAAMTPVEAAAP